MTRTQDHPSPHHFPADVDAVTGVGVEATAFRWEKFTFTYEARVPTCDLPYETTITGELDIDRDEDDRQVWKLTIEVPATDARPAMITRSLRVPGWREAVDYAELHGPRIARAAAVAREARRLFNEGIAGFTVGESQDLSLLPQLDLKEADETLEALAYDSARLVKRDRPTNA